MEEKADDMIGSYNAQYDDRFIHLLTELFQFRQSIDEPYLSYLLSKKNRSYFYTAFTDPKSDLDNNYLFFRTVGHVSYEKILVWYLSHRVPGIFTKNGQKIATILKSQIASSKKLGYFMQTYYAELWNYISMGMSTHLDLSIPADGIKDKEKEKEVMEDRHVIFQSILESIFGAVEYILDQKEQGLGNIILTKWIFNIFDEMKIDFNVNPAHHKHPKTKLNDILVHFNVQPKTAGKFEYTTTIDPSSTEKSRRYITEIKQVIFTPVQPIVIIMGHGKDRESKTSEKNAALETLRRIKKEGLSVYHTMSRNLTKVNVDVLSDDPLQPYD